MPHSPFDILARFEGSPYVAAVRRRRHQLHETQRTLGRDRVGHEVGLGSDDGLHQRSVDPIAAGGVLDDAVERLPARPVNAVVVAIRFPARRVGHVVLILRFASVRSRSATRRGCRGTCRCRRALERHTHPLLPGQPPARFVSTSA